jgi:hypothetical protein
VPALHDEVQHRQECYLLMAKVAVGRRGRAVRWPRRPGAFARRVDLIPPAQGAPGAVRIILHSVIQSGFRDPMGERTHELCCVKGTGEPNRNVSGYRPPRFPAETLTKKAPCGLVRKTLQLCPQSLHQVSPGITTSWMAPITGPSGRTPELPRKRTWSRNIYANGVNHTSLGRSPRFDGQRILASAEGAIHRSDEARRQSAAPLLHQLMLHRVMHQFRVIAQPHLL